MKFLIDVCASSPRMHRMLESLGHDVLSARDGYADESDESLLALAYEQNRVLITRDKDFGKLIFARGLPHRSVVRLARTSAVEQVEAMRNLLEQQSEAMLAGAVIVVTGKLSRIRFTKDFDGIDG